MITLHELKVHTGSRKRRKVVGRGLGSGHGTYSTRGAKGQGARKSGTVRPGFEGGRQPIIRQTPKLRGFTSRHGKFTVVAIGSLNKFENGATITTETLLAQKLVKNLNKVKLVAGGTLTKKLTVKIPVTESAKKAIEQAGGNVL